LLDNQSDIVHSAVVRLGKGLKGKELELGGNIFPF
jgi:hypothetical protein